MSLRLENPATGPAAILLSAMGLLILGVSGWLGGELVYVHGVAVAPRGDRTIVTDKTTAA